jgi:hypothetical protein
MKRNHNWKCQYLKTPKKATRITSQFKRKAIYHIAHLKMTVIIKRKSRMPIIPIAKTIIRLAVIKSL